VLIWGGTYNAHTEKLLMLQKKIVRIITHSGYLDHTHPLFQRTKILRFQDIYRYHLAIEGYTMFSTNRLQFPSHNYQTRNRNNAIPADARLAVTA